MARTERTLQLDREHATFLGVCAGLANYLDVEPRKIRLVFLVCCFFGGWFLVPLYFITWFLLDDTSSNVRNTIADNQLVRHFRTVDYRKKLYRNTRDGKILGVCAGIADYLEVSVFAVRLVMLLLFFLTGFPLLFYICAALVLDKRPLHAFDDVAREFTAGPAGGAAAAGRQAGAETGGKAQGAQDFKREQFTSRRHEFQYCARKFATLQQRLARMEAYVTSSRFKLYWEFKNLS